MTATASGRSGESEWALPVVQWSDEYVHTEERALFSDARGNICQTHKPFDRSNQQDGTVETELAVASIRLRAATELAVASIRLRAELRAESATVTRMLDAARWRGDEPLKSAVSERERRVQVAAIL